MSAVVDRPSGFIRTVTQRCPWCRRDAWLGPVNRGFLRSVKDWADDAI